ncbi:MAG TPA: NAD(P)H-dependent glycerol-3-phosphate dehydrogenase [Victivallales bacterium]|nr:NAD(P)H-dependent glycerol-3-phosphate dehydrogenase [Victivallales bacterium]HPO89751.1 NAD(P)H-dependent glycerol-3-phosphate dehydrogenase [Victivallales bacterium]HRR28097.1 NAD(P)H-dependent glycerol-3-phosphate dehydrogenase [Victivallales bacterium]
MKINATVLGDGAWGTAIALLLHLNGHKVSLWGAFPENICEIRKTRENSRFLPGIRIPEEIGLFEDGNEAIKKSELVVLAIPSQFLRSVLRNLNVELFKDKMILNLAKGIENNTLKRVSEVFSEEVKKSKAYAVLSGPSHAEEVSVNQPTAVVVASKSKEYAILIQKIFMNKNFRVYTSNDVIGVELGGALKNIYAIAAGISDGMKLGDNAKAALITRAIAELARLGKILGGKQETFSGLSGTGDIIVTCMSKHSRNRFVGEELGKGRKLNDILASMGNVVAEGVKTTNSAFNLAKKYNVDTPIINEVYSGLYDNKDPRSCLIDLMTRKAKSEF